MDDVDLDSITHLDVEADVRYWEDGIINDVLDHDGTLVPGRRGDTWAIRINLAEGRIENWPQGTKAHLHYKVADAGEYWLSNAEGRRLLKYKSPYVPTAYLCPVAQGNSDYIIMIIEPDGRITNFYNHEIDTEKWIPVRQN